MSEVLDGRMGVREERPRALFKIDKLSKWERGILEGKQRWEEELRR